MIAIGGKYDCLVGWIVGRLFSVDPCLLKVASRLCRQMEDEEIWHSSVKMFLLGSSQSLIVSNLILAVRIPYCRVRFTHLKMILAHDDIYAVQRHI